MTSKIKQFLKNHRWWLKIVAQDVSIGSNDITRVLRCYTTRVCSTSYVLFALCHVRSAHIWYFVHMVKIWYFAWKWSIISIIRAENYHWVLKTREPSNSSVLVGFEAVELILSLSIRWFPLVSSITQWGAWKFQFWCWDFWRNRFFNFCWRNCLSHSETHVVTNFEPLNSFYNVCEPIFDRFYCLFNVLLTACLFWD